MNVIDGPGLLIVGVLSVSQAVNQYLKEESK